MDHFMLPYLYSTEKLLELLRQRQLVLSKNINRDDAIKIYNQYILPLPRRECKRIGLHDPQKCCSPKLTSTKVININKDITLDGNNKINKYKRVHPSNGDNENLNKKITIDRKMHVFDKKRPHLPVSNVEEHPPTKHKKITYP